MNGNITTNENNLTLTGALSAVSGLSGVLSGSSQVSGTVTIPDVIYPKQYDGPYEFTPSAAQQTVPTAGLMATEDIVINAVPGNYGLIVWNGSILTVS